MKSLVEYIAQSIASQPDQVQVTEEWEGERVYVRLSVASDDKGKVIGRDGRVAQSIRSLLRVAAVKQDVHTVLEIE